MQNKPNFPDTQMNLIAYLIMTYENKSNWTLGENKPNLVRPALFAKESVDAAPDDALPDWSNPILPPILKISFLNFVKLYKILTNYEISF